MSRPNKGEPQLPCHGHAQISFFLGPLVKRTQPLPLSWHGQVIDDPQGSKLLLVMEFMEGGPVLTREALETQEKLPETMAVQYFRDMVKVGVAYNSGLSTSGLF